MTARLDCSCGLPLRVFKQTRGGWPVSRCEHCDAECKITDCARCDSFRKSDNHNEPTPKGKRIPVRDNGEGMPKQDAPKAIEPPRDEPNVDPPTSDA